MRHALLSISALEESKKYIIGNPAVGITLYLVIGVLIIPLYFAILNKVSSMEKRSGIIRKIFLKLIVALSMQASLKS